MNDTNQGEEVVEQTTQENPTPEAEDQTSPQPEETETSDSVEQNAHEEINEEEQTPRDNQAWAKMRVENKRLKEALRETEVDSEYLQQLKGVLQPQQQSPAQQYRTVSANDDIDSIAQSINEARGEAYRTRQEMAELKNQLRIREDMEAEMAYPELKTDPLFQQLVAEKKLASEVMGRSRPTKEIAREVKSILSRREEQISVQAQEQAQTALLQKQQATAQANTRTSNGQSSAQDEELRDRARRGDRSAQEKIASKLLDGYF